MLKPMLKPMILIAATAATPVAANCTPPFMPVFACNILTADQRVEICAERPAQGAVPDRYSYNFATGLAMSELYFETADNRFSTRYYVSGQDAENTQGIGLVHGDHVYAAYLTGVQGGWVRAAQIHVYDSLAAFDSDKGETEALRLYCEPDSIWVNWDFIGP